jgi:ribosomal protein L11 methyltransferase
VWYQLQIDHCRSEEIEKLSEMLEVTGALSITLTDQNDVPILEPEPGTTPLWPEVIINVLYEQKLIATQALSALSERFSNLHFSLHELADEDWERVWMKDFQPQRFGNNLWVCPSWTTPPEANAVNLILDPGLAFGTGTHPTTALCLTWLEQADLKNKIIIDYGCGSGILALAALKLGAAQAYAVDIDEQALQATQSNAAINHIPAAKLKIGVPDELSIQADLLIANILLEPLMNLNNRFKKLVKKEGTLIVSGILPEQAASLIKCYQNNYKLTDSKIMNDWSLLVFTRL